ncbi:hypothetical protein LY78DRAFT_203795 [Colletotrichum sublineola]|nr:hypothetical protein LY78DRAFT_203795 [Colletotrichum sublineola]
MIATPRPLFTLPTSIHWWTGSSAHGKLPVPVFCLPRPRGFPRLVVSGTLPASVLGVFRDQYATQLKKTPVAAAAASNHVRWQDRRVVADVQMVAILARPCGLSEPKGVWYHLPKTSWEFANRCPQL